MQLLRTDLNRWELPKTGEMRVSGLIYANDNLFGLLSKDKSLQQVRNVATLPGIIGHSFAMPDIHEGYGFPIGGVAAFDIKEGIISPGGVGYDINCGVRLLKTNLCFSNSEQNRKKMQDQGYIPVTKDILKTLTQTINSNVPTGVGSQGAIKRLSDRDLKRILNHGTEWAIENGYGRESHLDHIEENGSMPGGDSSLVSSTAKKRGIDQLGTLGSGNHFIEIGVVSGIFHQQAAKITGLAEGQITLMIHSGSRGLGHQVCDDYIKRMKTANKSGSNSYKYPDPQLISVPLNSAAGAEYYAAMVCAANFAWTNRQVMMSICEQSLCRALNLTAEDLGVSLIYDVSHNIAKIEEHDLDGKKVKLCVHRKGATRAFPPHHDSIPRKYQTIGQPVIIPGDMGRYSFLCLGTERVMKENFGSSCHGAGRIMSRKEALRTSTPNQVRDEMKQKGIFVHSATKSTLSEEMSGAYKDVSDVVNTMSDCGLLEKVAILKPLGVIKG